MTRRNISAQEMGIRGFSLANIRYSGKMQLPVCFLHEKGNLVDEAKKQPVCYHYGQFPPKQIDWLRLIPLLGPASASLARYDGVLESVPNAQVLLAPLMTQEAVLSSRIEGTQASMGEVLEYEAGAGPDESQTEKLSDIQEVLNYRRAIWLAKDSLEKLPLASRMVKNTHATLMDGVRGQNRSPGEYRKIQNWIGPKGCSESESQFVPISAADLADGMSAWEKYLHSKQPDALVQLAIVHAEFEALHPFLDGNGRLGRMLIPLFLFNQKILRTPTFYMSAYLEARREEYCERLLVISRDGDWTGWCEFFLKALVTQAESNIRKARDILQLYEAKKNWIVERTHSQHAIRALDFIFDRPIFRSSDFVARSGMPQGAAKRIIRVLQDNGLLRVIRKASGRRPAVLAFPDLMNIAEGKKVF